MTDPTPEDVRAAAVRIAGLVHRTPIVTCRTLDRITGAEIHLKCENLQKVGAFKARGASHAIACLTEDEAATGVCTHSSGNHAQALAWAAAVRGIQANIVMPHTAPAVKRAAVEGYGARITSCEPTLAAREAALAEVQRHTGAVFIHPYDDPRVIAGQGTAALELLEAVSELEAIVVPVGGGGLASGTCLAVAGEAPGCEVIGAEPAAADDAFRSLRDGVRRPSVDPRTCADGLLTALSERTFRILQSRISSILTVSESTILEAMRLLFERAKLVVEPSGAVPLAVILEHPDRFRGRRVGVILSGGNVDPTRLGELLTRAD
jgi:threonine dehydratase